MPYSHRKIGDKNCVYKADTGKKVGCTKGPISKYLAALHANVPDAKHENLNQTKNMNEANYNNPAITSNDLKKVVQYLAKEAESHQNYVGIDASYDVEFGTIEDIITDSKNKKLQNFWNKLSDKQQTQVYRMITQYLLNKEIKKDPEYFGDEQPKVINYTLSPNPTGKAPGGQALDKLVNKLAKDAESWMNYRDVDSPETIIYDDFIDFVIEDANPKIKDFWNSLDAKKQKALFKKVVAILEKKYGSDEDDELYEGRILSKMAKKIIKENKSAPLMLNGKEVDISSIELDGVDTKDYPDFSDAYISAAYYTDGTQLTDQEVQQLEKENYGITNKLAHDSIL